MATNNVKKNLQKKKALPGKPRMQHRFSMREVVYTNSDSNSVLNPVPTNGAVAGTIAFTAVGASGCKWNTTTSAFESTTILQPCLKWLKTQSSNFSEIRITRARLVIVGNLGSTATGTINVQGYDDIIDVSIPTFALMSKGGRTIDLASLASKEVSLNLPVNSSWKKITHYSAVPGGFLPFGSIPPTTAIAVNSVNDMFLTGFGYAVTGATGITSSVCNFFLDYDVEFKNPIQNANNY